MIGWAQLTIGDLGRVVTGRTPAANSPHYFGDDYLFVTPTDLDERRYLNSTERGISEIGAKSMPSQLIPARSVTVSCIGWQLGKTAIVGDAAFTNQQINSIVPNETVDHRFLYYHLRTRREEIRQLASGGTRTPILNKSRFMSLPINLPGLPVQARIADALGSLDDLIENNRRRVELLEQMAEAIYREWFVHFRYPGREGIAIVDSPLGPIPEGWDLLPSSSAVTINPRTPINKSQSHPFVSMGDLSERSMVCFPGAIKAGNSGAKFLNGDTLMARITPCLENGKTGFVHFLAGDVVGRGSTELIVLRGDRVGPAFTYFLARKDDFRANAIQSMSGASGRQRVRNECFDAYFLATPPPELGRDFEQRVGSLLEMAFRLATNNQLVAAIRDLLLPKLVTGQIDVSDLDLDSLLESSA